MTPEPKKVILQNKLKVKKFKLQYMVKDIICLIQSRNLFDSNKYLFGSKIFCLNQTNFISFKEIISLNQRKSFKQIIFFDSITYSQSLVYMQV